LLSRNRAVDQIDKQTGMTGKALTMARRQAEFFSSRLFRFDGAADFLIRCLDYSFSLFFSPPPGTSVASSAHCAAPFTPPSFFFSTKCPLNHRTFRRMEQRIRSPIRSRQIISDLIPRFRASFAVERAPVRETHVSANRVCSHVTKYHLGLMRGAWKRPLKVAPGNSTRLTNASGIRATLRRLASSRLSWKKKKKDTRTRF